MRWWDRVVAWWRGDEALSRLEALRRLRQHGGWNDPQNIVPLCRVCHENIHPWMKRPAVTVPAELVVFPCWSR